MNKLILMISVMLSFYAYAAHHENEGTTDGAFTTLMIAAPDVDKYIETLKANTSAIEITGATDAGVCVTKSGHEYIGQMMVWSAFPSVEAALVGSLRYDATKPSRFSRLREVKYGVTWKPLKPFRLEPGYERVMRVNVPAANTTSFVEAISKLEKAIQAAGHEDFFNGVFAPIGGGSHEAQTLMVRSITKDASSTGKIFDEYFDGESSWAAAYQNVLAQGGTVISDHFDECEQTYFSN